MQKTPGHPSQLGTLEHPASRTLLLRPLSMDLDSTLTILFVNEEHCGFHRARSPWLFVSRCAHLLVCTPRSGGAGVAAFYLCRAPEDLSADSMSVCVFPKQTKSPNDSRSLLPTCSCCRQLHTIPLKPLREPVASSTFARTAKFFVHEKL